MGDEQRLREVVGQWLAVVEEDMLLAKKGLEPPTAVNGSAYHCHQAFEKVLKAFLVSRNLNYPRTHDLLKLVERCEEQDVRFSELREDAALINPFASITRYPDYGEPPRLEEVEVALDRTGKVVDYVTNLIESNK